MISLATFFQRTCSSPNGQRLFRQPETSSYVAGFPLGCCDHGRLLCAVITAAKWKETLIVMVSDYLQLLEFSWLCRIMCALSWFA